MHKQTPSFQKKKYPFSMHHTTNNNNNHTNNNKTNNHYTKEITNQTHSYNDVFQDLQDYMFHAKNLTQYTKYNIETLIQKNIKKSPPPKKSIAIQPKPHSVKQNDLFSSMHKDTLFWCFYVLKNGFSDYETIGNQHFVIEKKIKFQYIDIVRQKKELLKMHKIKPFSDLEDDLANNEIISIKTFIALCIIENINVMIIHKRKFYESINNDTGKISIIYRNDEPLKYVLESTPSNETIQKYKDTYLKMSSYDSSLKAMSSYKLDELLDICKKLNILLDGTKKKTKKDIYQEIVTVF